MPEVSIPNLEGGFRLDLPCILGPRVSSTRLWEMGSVVPAWLPAWQGAAEPLSLQLPENRVASGISGVFESGWHQPLRKSCCAK